MERTLAAQAKTMTIGVLAARTGCNIETIRYYERVGVLPRPQRRGRYRHYREADVTRVGFVRRARELGFTLDVVRRLLVLSAKPDAPCAEVRHVAARHLADVDTRIANLQRMRQVLLASLSHCAAGTDAGCPVIDALAGGAAMPIAGR
jgi:MerR family mercuric resistance operon transcriptional regulator